MSDNTEKSTTKRAVSVAKGSANRELKLNEVEVSTGVIFAVNEVPQFTMSDIRREFKEPVVPTWYNKDTGRKEPNPDDPEYKRAHAEYMINMSMAVIDIMILMGTKAKFVPKGFPAPNSEDWERELRAILRARGWSREDIADITPEESYVFWVKYRAAAGGDISSNDSDINKITLAIGRLSGVAEEDVKDAVDTFRDMD
jgi:hypothetical protein